MAGEVAGCAAMRAGAESGVVLLVGATLLAGSADAEERAPAAGRYALEIGGVHAHRDGLGHRSRNLSVCLASITPPRR